MTAKDRFDSHDRCGEEEIILSSLAFHMIAHLSIDDSIAQSSIDRATIDRSRTTALARSMDGICARAVV